VTGQLHRKKRALLISEESGRHENGDDGLISVKERQGGRMVKTITPGDSKKSRRVLSLALFSKVGGVFGKPRKEISPLGKTKKRNPNHITQLD